MQRRVASLGARTGATKTSSVDQGLRTTFSESKNERWRKNRSFVSGLDWRRREAKLFARDVIEFIRRNVGSIQVRGRVGINGRGRLV